MVISQSTPQSEWDRLFDKLYPRSRAARQLEWAAFWQQVDERRESLYGPAIHPIHRAIRLDQ